MITDDILETTRGALPVIRGWLPGTIVNGRVVSAPIVAVAAKHRPDVYGLRGLHSPQPPEGLWVSGWECLRLPGAHLEVLMVEGQVPISCKFRVVFRYFRFMDIVRALLTTGGFGLCTTPPTVLPSGEIRGENGVFLSENMIEWGKFSAEHPELQLQAERPSAEVPDQKAGFTLPPIGHRSCTNCTHWRGSALSIGGWDPDSFRCIAKGEVVRYNEANRAEKCNQWQEEPPFPTRQKCGTMEASKQSERINERLLVKVGSRRCHGGGR